MEDVAKPTINPEARNIRFIRILLVGNRKPKANVLRQLIDPDSSTDITPKIGMDFNVWSPIQLIAGQQLTFNVFDTAGEGFEPAFFPGSDGEAMENEPFNPEPIKLNRKFQSVRIDEKIAHIDEQRQLQRKLDRAEGIFIVYGECMENESFNHGLINRLNRLVTSGQVVRFICQKGEENAMKAFMEKHGLNHETLHVIDPRDPKSVQQAFISMGERIVKQFPSPIAEAMQIVDQVTHADLQILETSFAAQPKKLHARHLEMKKMLKTKIEYLLSKLSQKDALALLDKVLDETSAPYKILNTNKGWFSVDITRTVLDLKERRTLLEQNVRRTIAKQASSIIREITKKAAVPASEAKEEQVAFSEQIALTIEAFVTNELYWLPRVQQCALTNIISLARRSPLVLPLLENLENKANLVNKIAYIRAQAALGADQPIQTFCAFSREIAAEEEAFTLELSEKDGRAVPLGCLPTCLPTSVTLYAKIGWWGQRHQNAAAVAAGREEERVLTV